jgi:hypothetical protein
MKNCSHTKHYEPVAQRACTWQQAFHQLRLAEGATTPQFYYAQELQQCVKALVTRF